MKKNYFIIAIILISAYVMYSCDGIIDVTNPSLNKEIKEFTFLKENMGFYSDVEVNLDSTRANRSYLSAKVPYQADLTELIPTIEISENATIEPPSGQPIDLTYPVEFIVTAEDGSFHIFIITVSKLDKIEGSSLLKSITLEANNNGFEEDIMLKTDSTVLDQTYLSAIIPNTADLSKLVPTIVIDEFATITPSGLEKLDFIDPVVFTVAIPDIVEHKFIVTIKKEEFVQINEIKLISAKFNDIIANKEYEASFLSENSDTLRVNLPMGLDILSLQENYVISEGATHTSLIFLEKGLNQMNYYSLTITSVDLIYSKKYVFEVNEEIPEPEFPKIIYELEDNTQLDAQLIVSNLPYPDDHEDFIVEYFIDLYEIEFTDFNMDFIKIVGDNIEKLRFSEPREIKDENAFVEAYGISILDTLNHEIALLRINRLKFNQDMEEQINLDYEVEYVLFDFTVATGEFEQSTNQYTIKLPIEEFNSFKLDHLILITNIRYFTVSSFEETNRNENVIEINLLIYRHSRYTGMDSNPYEVTIAITKQ